MSTTKWIIDPTHSEVAFKVKHLVISTVTGYSESLKDMQKLLLMIFQERQLPLA